MQWKTDKISQKAKEFASTNLQIFVNNMFLSSCSYRCIYISSRCLSRRQSEHSRMEPRKHSMMYINLVMSCLCIDCGGDNMMNYKSLPKSLSLVCGGRSLHFLFDYETISFVNTLFYLAFNMSVWKLVQNFPSCIPYFIIG